MKKIICADSLTWLKENKIENASIITSLPDAEEINLSIKEWISWFEKAVKLCLEYNPCIFYQTDRKHNSITHSKAFMIMKIAEEIGINLIWHKIALRKNINTIDLYRPGFTHLLCFGKCKIGKAIPDVFMRGNTIYNNGMGINAANIAIDFCKKHSNLIIDPFCGKGTIPAICQNMNIDSIGIDIDEKQCEYARTLKYNTNNLF